MRAEPNFTGYLFVTFGVKNSISLGFVIFLKILHFLCIYSALCVTVGPILAITLLRGSGQK